MGEDVVSSNDRSLERCIFVSDGREKSELDQASNPAEYLPVDRAVCPGEMAARNPYPSGIAARRRRDCARGVFEGSRKTARGHRAVYDGSVRVVGSSNFWGDDGEGLDEVGIFTLRSSFAAIWGVVFSRRLLAKAPCPLTPSASAEEPRLDCSLPVRCPDAAARPVTPR